jgi:hypothetical protein
MAFLIRSIHGAEVDDHPNRVALFDSLAPKAPSSLFSRVVRGPAPTRTLALVIVQFGRDGLGYKKLVEIDYYDSSSRYEIMKAMIEDVQAKIKTVLEDKDGPEKAVLEKQGTLQTTAVVPADVLTGALAENASVALTGQASEGTKRKRDASPSSGREDREAKKRKSAVDKAKKFGSTVRAAASKHNVLDEFVLPDVTGAEPSSGEKSDAEVEGDIDELVAIADYDDNETTPIVARAESEEF